MDFIEIAVENDHIWEEGKYFKDDETIHLDMDSIKVKFISPTMKINPPKNQESYTTKFAILEKSTVEVAMIFASISANKKLILNFASGRHPGGGYHTGARAQEESLCRSSVLYNCLNLKKTEFHDVHKEMKSSEYSDAIIYSENVPFFRDQNCIFLTRPIIYDVLSCAAINQSQKKIKNAEILMEKRIKRILEIAFIAGAKVLILGAFGTGVFANSAEMIADIFYRILQCEFKNCFEWIVFAILPDSKKDNVTPFQYTFRKLITQE